MAVQSASLTTEVSFTLTFTPNLVKEGVVTYLEPPFQYALESSQSKNEDGDDQTWFALKISPDADSSTTQTLESEIIKAAKYVKGTIGIDGQLFELEKVPEEEETNGSTKDSTKLHCLRRVAILPETVDESGNIVLDIRLVFRVCGSLESQLEFYQAQVAPSVQPFGLVEACTKRFRSPPDLVLYCDKAESETRSGAKGSTRSHPLYINSELLTQHSEYFGELLQTDEKETDAGRKFEEADSDLELDEDEEEEAEEQESSARNEKPVSGENGQRVTSQSSARVAQQVSPRQEKAAETERNGKNKSGLEKGRARSDSPEPEHKPSKKRRLSVDEASEEEEEEDNVASSGSPGADGQADATDSGYRAIIIRDCEYATLVAALAFLETGQISFAPLRIDGAQKRDSYVRAWRLRYPNRPVPVSCRSIFRLARGLGIDSLAQAALDNLRKQLKTSNVAALAISRDASYFPQFRKIVHHYARTHLSAVKVGLVKAVVSAKYEPNEDWGYELLGRLLGPVVAKAKFGPWPAKK